MTLVCTPVGSIVPENPPELSLPRDKLCFIIAKAREFDVKDVITDSGGSSNPTDDAMISVLEDHSDDPVVQKIASVIFAVRENEQIGLLTLAWLGRGDGTRIDWEDLHADVFRARNKRPASDFLGIPSLADYREGAIAQFGISCEA